MAENLRALMGKMEKEMTELKDIIGQKDEEIEEQKVENKKLHYEIRALKEQIAKMEKKSSVQHRPMPAELLNELFASLPFENAFALIAKMPNWLLQRNMRKMLKSIEMAIKKNKWNVADCGPNLAISEEGMGVKHNGLLGWNSVRAISPIPFFNLSAKILSIAAYFEVQIVHKHPTSIIQIGFCTQQLRMERKLIGEDRNSFGINAKGFFDEGDVIGVGLIYLSANPPMKCFATQNGELLKFLQLPDHFATLQFFPAATLYYPGESIRANFGQEKWLFNPSQLLQ